MKSPICEEQGDLDAFWARFFQKYLGHVGDGVGGVSAVADVGHRSDAALEVLRAFPLFEGLLDNDVAAVLKQGRSPAEFATCVQADALEASIMSIVNFFSCWWLSLAVSELSSRKANSRPQSSSKMADATAWEKRDRAVLKKDSTIIQLGTFRMTPFYFDRQEFTQLQFEELQHSQTTKEIH